MKINRQVRAPIADILIRYWMLPYHSVGSPEGGGGVRVGRGGYMGGFIIHECMWIVCMYMYVDWSFMQFWRD